MLEYMALKSLNNTGNDPSFRNIEESSNPTTGTYYDLLDSTSVPGKQSSI